MTLELNKIPEHLTDDATERLVVMGQQFTVRATPVQTAGVCFAFDCLAQPGMGVPMHVHDHEDELFILNRGTARFVVGDREVIVRAGDSLFAPRGVPHAWFVHGDDAIEVLTVVLPGNLEVMFRELGALAAADPARVGEICGRAGVRFV